MNWRASCRVAGAILLAAASILLLWENLLGSQDRGELAHLQGRLQSSHDPGAMDLTTWLDSPAFPYAVLIIGFALLLLAVWPGRIRRPTGGGASRHASGAAAGRSDPRKVLTAVLSRYRHAFVAAGLFSAVINILMLTGALYMLEVYDRVLPSRSVPTLVGLSVIAAVMFVAMGLLEFIRGRILSRVGMALGETLNVRLFKTSTRLPLIAGSRTDAQAPLRDLDNIRTFMSSGGPPAMFDLPWMPFYLFIIYLFHPLMGLVALVGAIVLVAITVAVEFKTREPAKKLNNSSQKRQALADAGRRNAEVVVAMGMGSRLAARYEAASEDHNWHNLRIGNVAATAGSISRTLRLILQSGILGVGAWLAIHDQATAGIIIAGSILFGRALAPVDAAIANAKSFVTARQSWERLNKLLSVLPEHSEPLPLPDPVNRISVSGVTVVAPGGQTPLVQNVSFAVEAGKSLGIVGPSGSGKSCLARTLAGAWLPAKGSVQLDGAALNQWSEDALGRHVGYVPQNVELFAGTIADNISRFDPDADPIAIVNAAKVAGVHQLITSFGNGYQTEIGVDGSNMSAGQRQRIALARALYGDPFLVVLDEPNSNLDPDGEKALILAIEQVKARNGIVIVVAHRIDVLSVVDDIIIMKNGWASQPMSQREEAPGHTPEIARQPGAKQSLMMTPGLAQVLRQASENRINGALRNGAAAADASLRSDDQSQVSSNEQPKSQPVAEAAPP